jgi:hypothetical protein
MLKQIIYLSSLLAPIIYCLSLFLFSSVLHLLIILRSSQPIHDVVMSQIIELESKYLALSPIYHIDYPLYTYPSSLTILRRVKWPCLGRTYRCLGKDDASFLRGCRSSISIE